MAPAAVELDDKRLRIYVGCWDEAGISRIGFIDVSSDDPQKVISVSSEPILNIGRDGTFDENGVFPAHATCVDSKIYLYYTGFMLGHKIRHYNFGGLALSEDGISFTRVSEAPVLDRADEGLHVRAGQSILVKNNIFHTCYSAGTGWADIGGVSRPTYDVFYQASPDGLTYAAQGKRIVACDHAVEHGLGRPQLIEWDGHYCVFYTRRLVSMRYHMGCAISDDGTHWRRVDEWIDLPYGAPGSFDSDMVYFPNVIRTRGGRVYLFYSGNAFGGGGLGCAEWMPS
jgi:hypothetical protein